MDQLARLYKYSCKGALQEWWIEVDGCRYRTHAGQVGGKTTTTEWTICRGKSIGRANATTAEEQAFRDAQSKWQKKQDREQFATTVEALRAGKFVQPMLAQKYQDCLDALNFREGVWVQCKLNGARCIATRDGLFSRKGSVWKSVPHIQQALAPFFAANPDVVLDGELFNDDLRQDLGSIISLVSKKKITAEDIEASRQKVKFFVYDLVDTTRSYRERYDLLFELVKHRIKSDYVCILAVEQVDSLDKIDDRLRYYESQGHEGLIVRTNGVYQNKRSKHLLKYKSFVDDEFEIVDVLEGEGNLTGKIGAFVLQNSRGARFNSAPTGSHAYWEQMWLDRDALVGKKATVKYKELTPLKDGKGGVPSFGKVIAIRDYEG